MALVELDSQGTYLQIHGSRQETKLGLKVGQTEPQDFEFEHSRLPPQA
ncbi:hypothetical protein [Desulfitobacterium sp.]|nr:hypothetical protein [Desulfitobacterium sp.]HVJ47592.1 hypothetical protein [Desulfitobacterium sp.]